MRKLLFATALLALLPTPASAQLYNPKTLEFNSPDHATTCPADACVSGYQVEYWLAATDPLTGSPVTSAALDKAKMTNVTGTTYRAALTDLVPLPAVPIGQTYVIRVIAKGATADLMSARSEPSVPFVLAAAPRTVTQVVLR
jgi:hypothetical protein